jgi:hypothetical protein
MHGVPVRGEDCAVSAVRAPKDCTVLVEGDAAEQYFVKPVKINVCHK